MYIESERKVDPRPHAATLLRGPSYGVREKNKEREAAATAASKWPHVAAQQAQVNARVKKNQREKVTNNNEKE